MAPTETLRELKTSKSSPKIIKVENKEDKKRIRELEKRNEEFERKQKDLSTSKEKKRLESESKKLAELEQEYKLTMGDKQKEIEKLRKKLEDQEKPQTPKKSPKKSSKKSPSKSSQKSAKKDRSISDEGRIDTSSRSKVIKQGMDTEEVIELIKTVVQSTNAGIPLETETLGKTGAIGKNLPKDFIKDLETIQKDKIKFIGSQGGSSVMNSTVLTHKDKMHLSNLGLNTGNLTNNLSEMKNYIGPSLEKELSDPRSACKIYFKFVVLKTLDNKELLNRIPTKLNLSFKFFTFQESNSTELKLVKNNAEEEPRRVEVDNSYGLVRVQYDENQNDIEDQKACRFEFTVDPSISNIKDENLTLIRYLKERNLSVDFFDSNSKIHIGSSKIPLVELLRQGKDLQSSGQE